MKTVLQSNFTTARYYTPSGRSIQAEGVVPDIDLARGELTLRQANPLIVTEADLNKHLTNDSGPENEITTQSTQEQINQDLEDAQSLFGQSSTSVEQIAEKKETKVEDYALYEAVNILQAISTLFKR